MAGPEQPRARADLRRQRLLDVRDQGGSSCPFSVWDISPVRNGQSPVTLFSGLHGYTRFLAFPEPVQKPTGGLHSLTVSNDGSRAYLRS